MRTYDSFLSFYLGNEYLIQLFLVGLFLVPWKKRRPLFLLRFLPLSAVYFVLGTLFAIPLPWMYLIMFVVYFFVLWASFDCAFVDAVYFAGNIYCIQFIISDMSYALSFSFIAARIAVNWFALHIGLSYLVTAVFCLPAWYFYGRKLGQDEKVQINSYLVFGAVLFFLIVSVFFTHYIPLAIPYGNWAQVYVKLFAAIFGAAILAVNLMNNKNTELNKDKQILQLLLQKDKEEYERARLNEEQLNIKYHDLKKAARLGIAEGEGLSEDSIKIPHLYFTGNRALDIILSAESRVCQENRIRLICTADGEALNEVGMRSYHIYSFMSNLLDNAIESLVKAEESKREIRLSVVRREAFCLVSVCNYTADRPVIDGDLPQTTKDDKQNHGFGSKSVKYIAERYGGSVRFSLEGDIFTALVMLPIHETEERRHRA